MSLNPKKTADLVRFAVLIYTLALYIYVYIYIYIYIYICNIYVYIYKDLRKTTGRNIISISKIS